MSAVLTEYETSCGRCGRKTWWYQELGDSPLCDRCWDNDVGGTMAVAKVGIEPLLTPVELAEDHRAYYQAHRVERAAYQRAYYQAHSGAPGYSFSKQPRAGRPRLTPLPAPA